MEKKIHVEHGRITLRFGAIDREFSISSFKGINGDQPYFGLFVVTDLDGQNQNMGHRAQCWWREGYRGRVIKCLKMPTGSHDDEDELFFLTTTTKAVLNGQEPKEAVFWLEDSQMEEFFDYLRIGDIIVITN